MTSRFKMKLTFHFSWLNKSKNEVSNVTKLVLSLNFEARKYQVAIIVLKISLCPFLEVGIFVDGFLTTCLNSNAVRQMDTSLYDISHRVQLIPITSIKRRAPLFCFNFVQFFLFFGAFSSPKTMKSSEKS